LSPSVGSTSRNLPSYLVLSTSSKYSAQAFATRSTPSSINLCLFLLLPPAAIATSPDFPRSLLSLQCTLPLLHHINLTSLGSLDVRSDQDASTQESRVDRKKGGKGEERWRMKIGALMQES